MAAFNNILCSVDFSPHSRRARDIAIELAGTTAALTVMHVWQPVYLGGPDNPVAGEVIQDDLDAATKALADWTAGTRATSRLLIGEASIEIVQLLAPPATYDLVVMGTHGRTGFAHVLLGSVAEKVLRHAPCAVLVIR